MKIIIKILIWLSIFFWISSYSFASVEPFSDIWWVSYNWTTLTLVNWRTKTTSVWWLYSLVSFNHSNWTTKYVFYIKNDFTAWSIYASPTSTNSSISTTPLSSYFYDDDLDSFCFDNYNSRTYYLSNRNKYNWPLSWNPSCLSNTYQFNIEENTLQDWQYIIDWISYWNSWWNETQTC